jgi:type I restriction enzyme R subunit
VVAPRWPTHPYPDGSPGDFSSDPVRDTGIDVPEIVNLVFAKPVYSYVKFWQMIGRGTRLCENLFGPDKHKSHFLIFDHWKNFEYFDQHYEAAEPKQAKSLPQIVFENRIKLAETALHQAKPKAFELAIDLIAKDIADLPGNTIAIKEKWKEIKAVSKPDRLLQFDAATKNLLLHEIAPLMQWRNIGGNEAAHRFDLLVCRLQTEHLKKSSSFDDLKIDLQGQLDDLRMNLSQVKAVAPLIVEARTADFWSGVNVEKLEDLRNKLRGVMQYRQSGGGSCSLPPKVIDIKEDPTLIERKKHAVQLEGLPYGCRHTWITRALDRDELSVQDVAEMAGTSVQQIERTYKTVWRRHKKLASLADKVHGNSQNIE